MTYAKPQEPAADFANLREFQKISDNLCNTALARGASVRG